MIRVKTILGDDVYGLWHVKKIVVHKEGHRFALFPNKESFRTRNDAERYAHVRTQRFVERKPGENENHTVQWRTVMKYLCAAGFISMMTIAVLRWREQP